MAPHSSTLVHAHGEGERVMALESREGHVLDTVLSTSQEPSDKHLPMLLFPCGEGEFPREPWGDYLV